MLLKSLSILSLVAVVAVSCGKKKDEENSPAPKPTDVPSGEKPSDNSSPTGGGQTTAAKKTPKELIIGTWLFSDAPGSYDTFTRELVIESGKITMNVICTKGSDVIKATDSITNFVLSDSNLNIKTTISATKVETIGATQYTCGSQIFARDLTITVDETSLKLSTANAALNLKRK